MRKTRFIAGLLVAVMMLSMLVACKNNGNTGTGTTNQNPVNTDIAPDLPVRDFEDQTFTIYGENVHEKFLYFEEEPTERVSAAVYDRNTAVEERFGVKLQYLLWGDVDNETVASEMAAQAITTGDGRAFNVVSTHVVHNSVNALKDLYLNWYSLPYINFENEWWAASTKNDLTVKSNSGQNVAFLAVGDFGMSSISATACFFFNKKLALDHQIPDLYALVDSGEWTLDKMYEVAQLGYYDLNSNTKRDKNDQFGFSTGCYSPCNVYLWSSGLKIYNNNNGELDYVYGNQQVVDLFDKLKTILKTKSEGVWYGSSNYDGMDMFRTYQAIMCSGLFEDAPNYLSNYEHEYGIIPYPKYNTNQKNYYTMVDGKHEALAVSGILPREDWEFTGIIMEALNAYTHEGVLPEYYENALKSRYSDTPDDSRMIELIYNSRIFDFGYVYGATSDGFGQFLSNTLKEYSNFSSQYKAEESTKLKNYQKAIDVFKKYAD